MDALLKSDYVAPILAKGKKTVASAERIEGTEGIVMEESRENASDFQQTQERLHF